MHYFSNKFSKITKLRRVSLLIFDFGDLKLRDLVNCGFSSL